jgi:hypothetical protein
VATLLGVVVRHERRLRLRFDTELAPAAFRGASLYRVTNRDGRGASPDVSGVLVVGADLHQVELALASDLVGGALYEVAVLGVPASDASTATGTIAIRPGEPTRAPSPVAAEDDADVLLYGVDLLHDGSDYVEAEDGDLATIGGEANLDAALLRRLGSDGLLWDARYGAAPRRYVDGSPGALPTLRGALVSQALADDRVSAADAVLDADGTFDVTVTPAGSREPRALRVPIRTAR